MPETKAQAFGLPRYSFARNSGTLRKGQKNFLEYSPRIRLFPEFSPTASTELQLAGNGLDRALVVVVEGTVFRSLFVGLETADEKCNRVGNHVFHIEGRR
jgi:hypothetical protein